jgi:hypothetical protein
MKRELIEKWNDETFIKIGVELAGFLYRKGYEIMEVTEYKPNKYDIAFIKEFITGEHGFYKMNNRDYYMRSKDYETLNKKVIL